MKIQKKDWMITSTGRRYYVGKFQVNYPGGKTSLTPSQKSRRKAAKRAHESRRYNYQHC